MKETMTKKIYLINFLPNKFILIEMKKYSQKSKRDLMDSVIHPYQSF